MRIEEIVYKDYLVFTKQSELPDWVISTMNENFNILQTANSLTDKIRVAGKQLPAGAAMVYNILKNAGYSYEQLKKFFPLSKKNFAALLSDLYKKSQDGVKNIWIQWMLQLTGFYVGTKFAASYRASDFVVPDSIAKEKEKLVADFNAGKIDAVTFDKELKNLAKKIIELYKKQGINITDLIESGGAKNEIANIQRMLLARGFSINSKGEINKVVTTSLAEGHKPDEYVAGASEAIVSQYHKSRSTAKPGYLVRSLNELLASLYISDVEDCKTKDCVEIEIKNSKIAQSVIDRYDCSGKLITSAPKIGSKIKLRSPLFCKAENGFCRKCLGEIFFKKGLKPGDPLLIVSTSIADALTGSALKSAHSGVKLNMEHIDFTKEI